MIIICGYLYCPLLAEGDNEILMHVFFLHHIHSFILTIAVIVHIFKLWSTINELSRWWLNVRNFHVGVAIASGSP